MSAKELKEIQREAEKQGWKVERSKKGHLIFYAPDGVNRVVAAGTGGRGRGTNNLISQLRRRGFRWKGR